MHAECYIFKHPCREEQVRVFPCVSPHQPHYDLCIYAYIASIPLAIDVTQDPIMGWYEQELYYYILIYPGKVVYLLFTKLMFVFPCMAFR